MYNKEVEIHTLNGLYVCYWTSWGWSYARMRVCKRKKFLGFIPYLSEVFNTASGFDNWSGYTTLVQAEKAKKGKIIKWAKNAVKEYEEYERSWSED